jgi:hypothetical protein
MEFEKDQIVVLKRDNSLEYIVLGKNKRNKVIALPVGEDDRQLNRRIFNKSDIRLKEENIMHIKQNPKGDRPPAPPKQTKKDLDKLYVDAIKLIDQLEEEKRSIIELDNKILSERNFEIEMRKKYEIYLRNLIRQQEIPENNKWLYFETWVNSEGFELPNGSKIKSLYSHGTRGKIKGIGEIYEILKEMQEQDLNKLKNIDPELPLKFKTDYKGDI